MPHRDIVRQAYDRIAASYDQYAVLEKEIGDRLMDRIGFRRDDPQTVLDLGCGTGIASAALKKAFRKAQVIGLDLSGGMLECAGRQSRFTRPVRLVNADMAALPFARHSADLVFSNLALPWLADKDGFFGEILRVLKPDGMFLFSALGPGSLVQLDEACSHCVETPAPAGFPDLLEVGDALSTTGFREPVMDIDTVTLHYPDLDSLVAELEATGSSLLLEGWGPVKENLGKLASAWPMMDGGRRFPLAFEIIYGTAFGPPEGQPRRTENGEIATFSVDSLLKSRNLGYD